jgi:hypothetical protein
MEAEEEKEASPSDILARWVILRREVGDESRVALELADTRELAERVPVAIPPVGVAPCTEGVKVEETLAKVDPLSAAVGDKKAVAVLNVDVNDVGESLKKGEVDSKGEAVELYPDGVGCPLLLCPCVASPVGVRDGLKGERVE